MLTNQILTCSEHQMQVELIILNKQLTKQQRLACKECINKMEGNYRFIGFDKFKQHVDDNQHQKNQIIDKVINQTLEMIEKIQNQVDQSKSEQIQKYALLQSQINLWKESLNETKAIQQSSKYYQEVDLFLKNDSQFRQINEYQIQRELGDALTTLLLNYQPKIILLLNQLIEIPKLLQANYGIFEAFQNEEISNLKVDKLLNKVEIKQMNEVQSQDQWCYAIQFDKKGEKMISTSNKDIKVWSFTEGKFQLIQVLKGHLNNVTCLLFTPQSDCIISGSYDQTLICWSMDEKNKFISQFTVKQHSGNVYCIILNKFGDELISSSKDKSIKIWKFDPIIKNLQIQQSLEKHNDSVYSVCLNQSETLLVSCGQDQQIIIWKRDELSKWQFNQIVTQSIQVYGKKLLFLNDDQFLWVTANHNQYNNSIQVYESKDGIFMENQESTIPLNGTQNQDYVSFPIQYNRERNLLIVRHKSIIYLMRQSFEGKFVIFNKIPCQDENSYGALSPDGKYLVFWDCRYSNKQRTNGQYSVIEFIYQ
ncbi:unnamed protein product (macronuclear) [Paramecium tetraurelia]|uniref:Ig-like domain-containing protein n=1 Tax=Paramecium tetraurelia TaxID=5888 RepID=A0CCV4_PARTE|nr:uncharacterized protein GSPATT00037406001 [Paramecium tetraurelia]CAK68621.1 unnamed protein product [Paramecium tetraurelia]|eukprot:XP_001436018.1 hypothetical protein (macronuclear) [Paramecium tetraurelia strain d4-2]